MSASGVGEGREGLCAMSACRVRKGRKGLCAVSAYGMRKSRCLLCGWRLMGTVIHTHLFLTSVF